MSNMSMSTPEFLAPDTPPAPVARPLDGMKVVDVSSFLAGPFCSTQLGEFGAEVIKVEQPLVGDAGRRFGTITESGESLVFLSESRNKKSVTLDLRKPAGADLLKQLIRDADVLVENFQPGTLEGWGLGWDVLHAVNPRLVMVRISGYGQTGPYSGRPGFGRIGNAFGGLSFLAGYPDRPPVTPGSATLPDYMAGIYGALGALLAIKAREKTGKGQIVDIGLYEPMFRMLDELAPAYHYKQYVRQRMGPGTVNVAPHSHYPTSDGRWIAIACTNDKIFERLAQAMGRPEVAEATKWGKLKERVSARDDVDAFVTEWTSSITRDQVLERCEAFQVPCGPVYAIDEIFEDPQYKARNNIVFVKDPRVGELAVSNVVPRLSDTPGAIDWLGPRLGSHNYEILGGRLGLSPERIEALQREGVV
jgi:crotonobetainyl-CoA:carnitine CoA-transferase CaiB-like acyl-CoA transferase